MVATQLFLEVSSRNLGKILPHLDVHIFQMGWFNHQLVKVGVIFGIRSIEMRSNPAKKKGGAVSNAPNPRRDSGGEDAFFCKITPEKKRKTGLLVGCRVGWNLEIFTFFDYFASNLKHLQFDSMELLGGFK